MLTLVEVTNARGDTLQLPMLDASAGYSVRDIGGLDPVKADLTTSSIAQRDGAQPQNARRDSRNITMKVGFEPDYVETTVQSLKTALYKWFLPKANIDMAFYLDDVLYVTTSGQVESCDNPMFTDDPEVDISVICYDPDFYGPDAETVSGNTVSDTNTTLITYEGSTEAGIIFEMTLDRDLDAFAIYNTTPENVIQVFSAAGTFLDGDTLRMNSVPGSRSFTLIRDMIESSGMFYSDPLSNWISLTNGDNQFRVFADGAAIPYSVTYTPKYGAI
jgi:hypothetical protein